LPDDESSAATESPKSPRQAAPGLGQTLPLAALGQTLPIADHAPKSPELTEETPALPTLEQAPLAPFEQVTARSESSPPKAPASENSTVPARVALRNTSTKPAAAKAPAPAPVSVPPSEASSLFRTLLLAGLAAAASFYVVRVMVPKFSGGPAEAPAPTVSQPLVAPVAPSAPPAAKLQIHSSDSPLPPDSGVPAGSGLLEIQVAEGTAIRVDGEYLGMGPARRVPLTPGAHSLTLGDNPALDVSVKAGQLTSVSATGAAPPARP
jgi:hypothetical protein